MYQGRMSDTKQQQQQPQEEPQSASVPDGETKNILLAETNNENASTSSKVHKSQLYLLIIAAIILMAVIIGIAVPLSNKHNNNTNALPQPVPTPSTTGCTPCTQPSDCHDAHNVEGLNEACGELSCIAGICTFEAWADSGECASSNFVECAGDDGKCTKGPIGVKYEGACTGFGNNECIYTWCPGDQGGPAPPTTAPPPRPTNIWQPKPRTTWQWQLTGTIDTSFDVDMYDIDLFDVPQSVIDKLHGDGRIVVCYFSAGSYENWRSDAGSFSTDLLGSPLEDWPGEWWVDIRMDKIDALGPIMQARLDLAVAKNCDAVEPDNIDGYQNNNGLGLTYNDQLMYNRWLAAEAHKRGLSIGLKNDLDQVTQLIDDFDWALNEECYQFNECDRLVPFINAGKAVFGVEYDGNPVDFCPQLNSMQFSWLKKDLDLGANILADCMADY